MANHYFATEIKAQGGKRHAAALERCVKRLRAQIPVIGLRNPKIGTDDNKWVYCDGLDWVMGFQSGQYWLAYQLTGDSVFRNAAQARRPEFKKALQTFHFHDHDLGFEFSLHSVADWLLTGDPEAREMGLTAAFALASCFHPEGNYIQAWTPFGPHDREQARFVNGRIIVDTMQNLGLLFWAYRETGISDYRDIAIAHANTAAQHLIRADDTSFHTFQFDAATGEPLHGQTHQGYSDDSCWARGHAWLMHGFSQCYVNTGDRRYLDIAQRVCAKAEELVGDATIPVWDFLLPEGEPPHQDSAAAAAMAAGLYLLADQDIEPEQANRWRCFADRLIEGLLETCDLTEVEDAQGFLAHAAAHVPGDKTDSMVPYGDYYFMEALMRSQGHTRFFW